jgi:hypothetical protein
MDTVILLQRVTAARNALQAKGFADADVSLLISASRYSAKPYVIAKTSIANNILSSEFDTAEEAIDEADRVIAATIGPEDFEATVGIVRAPVEAA